MKIELLKNAQEIRKTFIKRFVMSWGEFQNELKDFIKEMSKRNEIIDIEFYNKSYLWDKISSMYTRVSFREALSFLSSINSDVFFMSENETHEHSGGLLFEDKEIKGFVAKASAKELVELIEHEWFEVYVLAEQGMYNPNPVLPEDLYVFDESLSWFVVCTHETTDWETDDLMKEAESRYCILFTGNKI